MPLLSLARLTSAVLIALTLLAATSAAPASAGGSGRGSTELDGFERELVRVINQTRRSHGLRRLKSSRRLRRAADYHSAEMVRGDFFDHASSNGWSFPERIYHLAHARGAGEVIAHAPPRARVRAVLQMWLSSPLHRATLVDGSFRRIGIARRVGSYGAGTASLVTADLAR